MQQVNNCKAHLYSGFPMKLIRDSPDSFIHSFILETYIAPLPDTTTQRRSYSPVTAKEEGLNVFIRIVDVHFININVSSLWILYNDRPTVLV